jgi:hypothetical protein
MRCDNSSHRRLSGRALRGDVGARDTLQVELANQALAPVFGSRSSNGHAPARREIEIRAVAQIGANTRGSVARVAVFAG